MNDLPEFMSQLKNPKGVLFKVSSVQLVLLNSIYVFCKEIAHLADCNTVGAGEGMSPKML